MKIRSTVVAAQKPVTSTVSDTCPQRASAAISAHRFELPSEGQDAQSESAHPDKTCFVALSRFTAVEMADQVKQAFRQRPHRVDDANGFVRMDVISPVDAPNEIWLFTYWKDETSYRTWHHSHLYKESHQGIPKGLRLAPKSVSIRFFEHVAT